MGGSLRTLGRFWAGLLLVLFAGAAVLQVLGPPETKVATAATMSDDARTPAKAVPPAPPRTISISALSPSLAGPGRDSSGPIAAPDPELLDPTPTVDGGIDLPRIGADGRMPMQMYARGFDRTSKRPRVALLVAGVGLNEADSDDAIHGLPGEVTLAFSPYGSRITKLAETARSEGHEFLISIPMEPTGYPLNDPGNRALLVGASDSANRRNLEWTLERIAGYVGATGALGAMRGERFATLSGPMRDVMATLSRRGLLYVDPRPGAPPPPPGVWSRAIDLVVDDPPQRGDIEARLRDLERIARERGSALGLVTAVRPVTTERIAAWARSVGERGLTLAPVSAVMNVPAPLTSADAKAP